jgi:hypothetical protein
MAASISDPFLRRGENIPVPAGPTARLIRGAVWEKIDDNLGSKFRATMQRVNG